jgi:hypothetical protein
VVSRDAGKDDKVNDKVRGTATEDYVNDDVNVYVFRNVGVDVIVDVVGRAFV